MVDVTIKASIPTNYTKEQAQILIYGIMGVAIHYHCTLESVFIDGERFFHYIDKFNLEDDNDKTGNA